MIEIIASVCLIANAAECKDVRFTFLAEAVSPRECMMFGQFELAKWSAGNPNWAIRRWSCGVAGRVAKI
jgi:hypothetical protein